MFDIAWTELLVIAVVAIVVVGPKELPRLLRTIGQYTAKIRAMASDFKQQLDDAVKETGIEDVKSDLEKIKNPMGDLRNAMNPLADDFEDDFKKMAEEEGLDEATEAEEDEAFWEEYEQEDDKGSSGERAADDAGDNEIANTEETKIVEPAHKQSPPSPGDTKTINEQAVQPERPTDDFDVTADAAPTPQNQAPPNQAPVKSQNVEPQIKSSKTVNGAANGAHAPALDEGNTSEISGKTTA